MSELPSVLTLKAWRHTSEYEVPCGFRRGTSEDFNTLRIGRLVIAWGREDA